MSVVLVPRGGQWGADVAAGLAEVGLSPWVLPLIETLPAPSPDLTAALFRLDRGDFDWLALTSAAAVPALEAVTVSAPTRVAAVGEATARALAGAGVEVAHTGHAGAQELVDHWPAQPPGRVLAIQSDIARPMLVEGLQAAGWEVDTVVAYRTAAARLSAPEEYALRSGKADVALVTSGSVATRLVEVGVPETMRLIAMGAATAADIRALGLSVAATAARPTIEDLVTAAEKIV